MQLEIKRRVLGKVDKADHNGNCEMLNVFEDARNYDSPYWWHWYTWPDWGHQMNGLGLITWKLTLEPQKTVDLGYSWHYLWR